MIQTQSSSTEPLPEPAASPDRRIAITLGLGIILFLFMFFKFMYFRHNAPTKGEGEVAHLLWQNNNLSVRYGTEDNPEETSAPIQPEAAPFFFQPVPINRADTQLIESIDGVGPHLASEILRLRENGFVFRNSRDLLKIPGIGEKKLRKLEGKFSFAEKK